MAIYLGSLTTTTTTTTTTTRSVHRVRASWDLFPETTTIIPSPGPKSKNKTLPKTKSLNTTKPLTLTKTPSPLSQLFTRLDPPPSSSSYTSSSHGLVEEQEKTYLGYDTWLPVAPKVKKPRSIYNAASLAYIGDCIYELYARRHFLFPPLNIEEYNDRVRAVVRCEAQDALLKKLLEDDYLSEQERDVLRWGKNIISGKTKTKKRAGVAVYNRASSLETLVGFLYLTDKERLDDVMLKLGFTMGASSERILASLVVQQ